MPSVKKREPNQTAGSESLEFSNQVVETVEGLDELKERLDAIIDGQGSVALRGTVSVYEGVSVGYLANWDDVGGGRAIFSAPDIANQGHEIPEGPVEVVFLDQRVSDQVLGDVINGAATATAQHRNQIKNIDIGGSLLPTVIVYAGENLRRHGAVPEDDEQNKSPESSRADSNDRVAVDIEPGKDGETAPAVLAVIQVENAGGYPG